MSKGFFRKPTSFIHAVDDVSFTLGRGESLGMVGESGCGKTTIGKLLVRLLEPDEGRVLYRIADENGETPFSEVDISTIAGREMRDFRRNAQMIFQDPYESMNPRRTLYDIISEPLSVQKIGNLVERIDRVTGMLSQVGLTPPGDFLFRHPHELSGGQRQRVAIARALVIQPQFVVADEPTSMLDVSSRTGIMLLMQQLARDRGISYLYVTHDLAVARYMCDRIAVMYLGRIVELAETEELLRNPLHPYTRALLSAVPVPDPGHRRSPPDILGDLTRSWTRRRAAASTTGALSPRTIAATTTTRPSRRRPPATSSPATRPEQSLRRCPSNEHGFTGINRIYSPPSLRNHLKTLRRRQTVIPAKAGIQCH